jgi:hypothetical protein
MKQERVRFGRKTMADTLLGFVGKVADVLGKLSGRTATKDMCKCGESCLECTRGADCHYWLTEDCDG